MAYVTFSAPAREDGSVVESVKDLLGKVAQAVKRDERNENRISVKTSKPADVRSKLTAAGYTL